MIFQPSGGSGGGGGLTAKTGVFAGRYSGQTVPLGFKAKACIVAYESSADNIGFLVPGGSTNIRASAEGASYYTSVSLSSDGMTLSAGSESNISVRYLALG